jgi:hypothetical protein
MTECEPQRKTQTLKNLCHTTVNDHRDKVCAILLRQKRFLRLFAVARTNQPGSKQSVSAAQAGFAGNVFGLRAL